jgi:NADPH:quinone reductase-like Zn-dependent oxidoreductase
MQSEKVRSAGCRRAMLSRNASSSIQSLASLPSSHRHANRRLSVFLFATEPLFALYIAGGWLLPGRKRVVPYSIQTLKRLRPALFRQDLTALFDLLQQKKIKPLIAQRFSLTEARRAHELLGKEGVTGKIVLVCGGQ